MTFKEAYKFPLRIYHGMVFTAQNDKAIDFASRFHSDNPLLLSTESKEKIIAVINGDDRKLSIDLQARYNSGDGWIYANHEGVDKQLILIRGWGHLTGVGGLNLNDEVAARLQDELAAHIVERLNQATA